MKDTFYRAKMDLAVVSVLYFLAVVLYFLPLQIPHKLAFPVALLFLNSLKLLPWQMSLVMLFSCLGDYFGSCGNFIAQMAAFALAHLFLICYFVARYRLGVLRHRYNRFSISMILAIVAILPILIFAFTNIYPNTPDGVIRYGVLLYIILISLMFWCALQQRSLLFASGGLLFLFSDAVLAWNRFVEPVANNAYWILFPYYLAQWLLFMRSTKWWGRYMGKVLET